MKIPAVLAVISAFISAASGAAVAAPASDPASGIQDSSKWTIKEIDTAYTAFTNRNVSRRDFDDIIRDKSIGDLSKWDSNLKIGSTGDNEEQWMCYYMLIKALRYGEFEYAVDLLYSFYKLSSDDDESGSSDDGSSSSDDESSSSDDEEEDDEEEDDDESSSSDDDDELDREISIADDIRELMRGGPNSEYEGILIRLFKAEKKQQPGDDVWIEELRSKLSMLAYGADYNFYKGRCANCLLSFSCLYSSNCPHTEHINVVRYYTGLMKATKTQIKANLDQLIAYNSVELANVALTKLTTGEGSEAGKALADNGIWSHVESEMMAKLLLKKFEIPIFKSTLESVRSDVYSVTNELTRYKVLEMLKIKNTAGVDEDLLALLSVADYNSGMKGHLEAEKESVVGAFFNRPDFTRAMYDPKWIIHAIKHSNHACLRILLEERVPLPAEAELTEAYAQQKQVGTKAVVDSYRAKYTALDSALAVLPQMAPKTLHDPTFPGCDTGIYPEVEQIAKNERRLFRKLKALVPT